MGLINKVDMVCMVIYVAAKKFWFGTIELIENLFFYIANK